jgi:hypothetical protein
MLTNQNNCFKNFYLISSTMSSRVTVSESEPAILWKNYSNPNVLFGDLTPYDDFQVKGPNTVPIEEQVAYLPTESDVYSTRSNRVSDGRNFFTQPEKEETILYGKSMPSVEAAFENPEDWQGFVGPGYDDEKRPATTYKNPGWEIQTPTPYNQSIEEGGTEKQYQVNFELKSDQQVFQPNHEMKKIIEHEESTLENLQRQNMLLNDRNRTMQSQQEKDAENAEQMKQLLDDAQLKHQQYMEMYNLDHDKRTDGETEKALQFANDDVQRGQEYLDKIEKKDKKNERMENQNQEEEMMIENRQQEAEQLTKSLYENNPFEEAFEKRPLPTDIGTEVHIPRQGVKSVRFDESVFEKEQWKAPSTNMDEQMNPPVDQNAMLQEQLRERNQIMRDYAEYSGRKRLERLPAYQPPIEGSQPGVKIPSTASSDITE